MCGFYRRKSRGKGIQSLKLTTCVVSIMRKGIQFLKLCVVSIGGKAEEKVFNPSSYRCGF